MAEGIRIQPTVASGLPRVASVLVVRDHDRPVPPPTDGTPLAEALSVCDLCSRAGIQDKHYVKTYHIFLEADGTSIVSSGVWQGLQACAENPFEAVNPVPSPPTISLVLHDPRDRRRKSETVARGLSIVNPTVESGRIARERR